MYRLTKRISLLALVAGLMSCEKFLEEVPKSQASPENYYFTPAHAEAAVIGAYNALQRAGVYGHMLQYFVTDIERNTHSNNFGGMGTYVMTGDNTEVLLPIWTDHYQGINEANTAITRIPDINMDEKRMNTLLAEAKFLRSLLYFNLIRIWGDVPYKVSETNSLNELHVPRTPVSTIYEGIINDLEYGITNLNIKGQTEVGRATVDAAKTLLAKVYLTRGSMAKRDGIGDGLSDFQLAAQLANEVIASNRYALCPYFPDAFIPENKNNSEIIFDVQFKNGGIGEGNLLGMQMGLMGPYLHGGSWGNIRATEYYNTIFETTDVIRRDWSTPHIRVMDDGTLRTDYPINNAEPWKLGKFRRYPVRNPDFVFNDYNVNWPVFRFAEVYLIYAEALNEVHKGQTPPPEIFAALNQLRWRARHANTGYIHDDILPRELTYQATALPDISPVDYPDYESLNQYIMDERAREFGGECKRWFDLVRWGKLVENIKFLKTYKPTGRNNPERNWDIVADNVKEHHMLMPIPNSEIHANPLVKQNKGY